MIEIRYPSTAKELAIFHEEYISKFNVEDMQLCLDLYKQQNMHLAPFLVLTVADILVCSIDQLWILCNRLTQSGITLQETRELAGIFNYDSKNQVISARQEYIADFFMNNTFGLSLDTCFYCNIDHINSISGISDYQNWQHFYLEGSMEEFQSIEGIAEKTAIVLVNHRNAHRQLDTCRVNKNVKDNFRALKLKNSHNHFTLDHVLDKATHPLAALSLYNLVPSCYGCNSKFKGSSKLVTAAAEVTLSPTSSTFDFNQNTRFKLYFPMNPQQKYSSVNVLEDFVLVLEVKQGAQVYDKLIKVFKLRSRYTFHKKQALQLISKKQRYSDSRIDEIASILKTSADVVRKDIFGAELFSEDFDGAALVKLKRDIGKEIGIIGVI